jgi:copper chaperone
MEEDLNFKIYFMKKHQFKTNINCSACVAKVTPYLSENEQVKNWEVDTSNPKKILTVESDSLEAEDVQAIIEKAGYKAESI